MLEKHRSREMPLGNLTIRRALPVHGRRLIGRWCFLDRYGPVSFTGEKPMDVAAHPHIGIQTVTWLLEGEVVHHDSLGYEALARPGAVNVMTSGGGIAHAEETPPRNGGRLSGVQLWVALPDVRRNVAASFEHIAEVPRLETRGGVVQTFVREADLAGRDLEVHRGETLQLDVDGAHEHGIFVLGGDAELDGEQLEIDALYYLEPGRSELAFRSANGARVLLLAGVPFAEPILMWWNFVARTPEEIAAARADWEEGRRFGPVSAYAGPRLSAPPWSRPLLNNIQPNPAS